MAKSKTDVERKFVEGVDGTGKAYVEVVCNDIGEFVRVTAVPRTYGEDGAAPAVRIQIHKADGRLVQGPEFAGEYLPDVMWALTEVGRRLWESKEGPT